MASIPEQEPLLGSAESLENEEAGVFSDTSRNELPQRPSPPTGEAKQVLVAFVRSTFGFNKAPFSLLFVLTFAAIVLVSSVIQSGEPIVDSTYPSKCLSNAWMDLQVISKEFHPYNSHANDRVHDYVLQQISDAALDSYNSYLSYDDDVRRILFQAPDVFNPAIIGRANYHESNNILAKVEGQDPTLPAVLVSAHYDSVPTAYGTTDDGAGIASMLSIFRYFSERTTAQPLRTIIFNFNNDEEFGLLGAQAFFSHPWSKNVSVFLNLEGTGAGGRAILFRATDYGVAKHFKAASSPHANSMFQQGFSDGLIRSETDYKVYTNNGLRGLDVAFYKPRNLYHTRRDSIRETSYSALSHMFTNALDVTLSLANAAKDDFDASTDDTKPAVFFDILGNYLVILPLGRLFQIHLVGLIGGPLILALLLFAVLKTRSWAIGVRGWLRGIFSLALSVTATIFTAMWIHDQNELIVVSDFYNPMALLLSVFLITNYIILSLGSYISPVSDQKLVIFLESFVLLWALLVVSTVHITNRKATGEFGVVIVYFLYFFSAVLGLLGMLVVQYDSYPRMEDQRLPVQENESEISHGIEDHHSAAAKIKHVARQSLSFDWSLQFVIVFPISFYIVYSIGLLTFEALHHNALEGASGSATVYTLLTILTIAIGFLVLPFIHRLHLLVLVILLILGVSGGILSLTPFPLTHEAPMKIRFLQSIDLDNIVDGVPKAEVSVNTRTGYGYSILSDLPSVKAKSVPITCTSLGSDDNERCTYEGPRPWVVSNEDPKIAGDYSDWLNVTVLRKHSDIAKRNQHILIEDDDENFGPFSGEIYIRAKENRQCNIVFNTTTFSSNDGTASPVRMVTVHHDTPVVGNLSHYSSKAPDAIKWYKGINDLTVHKLNWTQPGYHLEFQWIPRWYEAGESQELSVDRRSLGIHVTCVWGEYDAESVVGTDLVRRVPALDEVLEYSPPWVTWTNWGPGLVEVKKYIEI